MDLDAVNQQADQAGNDVGPRLQPEQQAGERNRPLDRLPATQDLQQEAVDDVLVTYGLEYRQEYGLLICRACQRHLTNNFARHLKDRHNMRVSAEDVLYIQREYEPNQSRYLASDLQELLPPLDYRPVLTGWACSGCDYLSQTQKKIAAHIATHYEGAQAVPCHLQTLTDSRFRQYIRVFPEQAQAVIQRNPPGADVDEATEMMESIQPHFPELAEDPGLFMGLLEWHEWINADTFRDVDFESMVSSQNPVEANWSDQLRAEVLSKMEAVNAVEFGLRNELMEGKKAFSSLKSKSQREYAAVFVEFIRFAVEMVRHPGLVDIMSGSDFGVIDNPVDIWPYLSRILTTPVSQHPLGHPLICFVFLSSYRNRQQPYKVAAIERVLAKMMYLCRLVACSMAVFYNRDQAIAAVTLDHRNAFSQLVYLKGAAHAEVKSTVRPAKVTLTDDPNVFYVGTCLLHVNSIRMAYHRAVSRCRELQERLLLGCPSDLDKDRIFDSPSDERTGFGLMADKDPGLDQRKKASLLRHVLSTPRHRQEFGLFDGSINGSRVRRYMADYDEYMENMVLVAHLGSGLPARSTELSTYTLINGRSSLRSIYYSGGQVMLLCSYSKVRSLLQANRTIARFLDKEASDLMIKDQLFVRPFVAFLAKKCLLDPSGRYLYHLWVRDGQVMSCDALRKVFVRLTTLYSNCPSPLQFGDYRHLAKHISNLLSLPAQYREAMKEYEDEGDEEADDGDAGNGDGDQEEGVIPAAAEHLAMARQMGHSLSTGVRVYGRTNEAHKHLAGHSIHMFRVISSAWHQFISVPEAAGPRSVAHTLPGNRECIGIPRLSPLDVEGISARSEPPIAVRSLTVATPSTLFALVSGKAALSSDWAPPLRILRSGPEGRRLAMEPYTESVDDVTFLQPAEDTTRNLVYNCNFFPNESNEELDLLKKLYGPDASFKSEAQSIAADYIVQGNSNVFIVLPTGGGKSALIFLLAVKEPHLTSLVVVPTVSLAQDLAQRARSLGISAAVGLHCYDEQERHSILIVTPEAVCFQENLEKLMLLKLRGLLFKIVIDEAHVLFNDASWRRSLQRLPTIGCLGLPMILLSGSCPPEETSLIIEAFFTEPSRPIMIRDGTNRPNISYQVETVSDDAEFFHCLKLILENFFENSNAESLMIVFVTQRSHVEILMQRLFESGFSCQGYHGGMNSRERETAFNSWNPSQDRVMVATSAFGMGIDRPCVRLVVMYGQPYSLLEYAQQSGRAGRDGKGSNAVLFYSVDSVLARINRTSDPVELRNYQLMNFFATARVCRRRIISQYLDDKETSCRKNPENILCDNCGPQSTIMASILGRSLKTNSVAMPVSVASSGSVVVGAELIRNDRDICRKLPDLLEKLGNCCGLHLSDNPAQPPRFCGQHCSLVTGKCNFCLCAGHYVDKCSLKKSMKIISSELFCFNCFRPVLRNVHSGDFTNCRLPKTMKDFFFWRVNTMGYDSKNIDVTKLCHDFIRAAETSLASRHSTGSTASRLTAATASTPSAPPASTANAATASSVNTHTSEFTRISAQSQVEDVKKEKLSEKFSELERCLDIFRHKCIICTFEESSTNNHVTSSCPRIKRLCIRCLGSHTSKECELKVPNYCCSRCLLPKAEHAKYGHGPNCKYDFNDLLKYFGCMFARQGRKTEAAVCEYMNTTKDGVHVVYKAFIEFVSSLK